MRVGEAVGGAGVEVGIGVGVGVAIVVTVGGTVPIGVAENPITCTGVLRFVVIPSPSWPLTFHPQHLPPFAAVRPPV